MPNADIETLAKLKQEEEDLMKKIRQLLNAEEIKNASHISKAQKDKKSLREQNRLK